MTYIPPKFRQEKPMSAKPAKSHHKKAPEKQIPGDKVKAKLATVPKAEVAVSEPAIKLTATFKKEAAANDKAIDQELTSIGKSYVALGELFRESKEKGYHVAAGFNSFSDYVEAKSVKSKSKVYQAIDIVKELTSGDKPAVSKTELEGMTQENAESLSKLKKQGVKITPKLVEQAQTLPVRRFQTEIVHKHDSVAAQKDAVKHGTPIAGSLTTSIKLTYDLLPETAADLSRCVEIARYVTRDADDSIPFIDRALRAICAEFESAYRTEYEQAKADEEAKGLSAAATAIAQAGPERTVELEEDESLLDPDEDAGNSAIIDDDHDSSTGE
jgi:hypothetical protein